ncbi:hypothetical protein TeGR_g4451 [Tetraparma gracilis]|uniref:Chalcone isomerase domain-containing protein n=1 Tax=Tetraparma gracilis TaxID=2962635 RepID=A0ABQ6N713_9STRA|nr:hypothetical protein TeGR_g4451 [Tetraparma gracilis]
MLPPLLLPLLGLLGLLCVVSSAPMSNIEPSTRASLPLFVGGLPLLGTGVRKKGPIKVYAVSLYSPSTDAASDAPLSSGKRAVFLKTVMKLPSTKMSAGLVDALSSRFGGPGDKLEELAGLIVGGCGGAEAGKGTTMQFECSKDAVGVAINGKPQGVVSSPGLGRSFVDIFTDRNAVSTLSGNLKKHFQ